MNKKGISDQPQQPAPPTQEQWAALYEVAGVIAKQQPWELLWDSDLITLQLPGMDEPVFCSVMGKNGECYAIGVYPGNASYAGYLRMAQAQEDEPPYISLFQQNCLMCNFGDREELIPQDRTVLKSLDLKFRGKNNWIYFRSMKPGFYPWLINAEQADILIQALQNFSMIYACFREGKLSVNFENGETLLRFYSEEKKLWYNTAGKLPQLTVQYPSLIIKDELFVARLKKQRKTTARLEFDLCFLPIPVQENKELAPTVPKIALLADKKSGMMLDQEMADADTSNADLTVALFAKYVMAYGRPAALYVRSEQIACCFEDLCEKIGVKLIQDAGVPSIDAFFDSMLNYLR